MEKLLILIMVAFMALCIIDGACGKRTHHTGIVIDKNYKSESTGVGTDSRGKAVIIHESEKWVMQLKCSTGEIISVDTKKELYYKTNVGDKVEYSTLIGLITKSVWSADAEK